MEQDVCRSYNAEREAVLERAPLISDSALLDREKFQSLAADNNTHLSQFEDQSDSRA